MIITFNPDPRAALFVLVMLYLIGCFGTVVFFNKLRREARYELSVKSFLIDVVLSLFWPILLPLTLYVMRHPIL